MHCHSALPYTVKPLNSRHLRVLKKLFVIERFRLLEGDLKKIDTFGTKRFVCSSWHVRYLGCPLLGVSLYNILDNRGKWQNLKQEKLSIRRKRISLLFFGIRQRCYHS